MSSILIRVAEDVKDALNAGTFGQKFEAIRSYADWELPLEESIEEGKVFVDVVPVPPVPVDIETRGSLNYQPAVDIIVRRRMGPERRDASGKYSLAELDPLTDFIEELAEFFVEDELANGGRWNATEIRRAFVPAHLHGKHQFTGIVRVTFDAEKSL